MSAAALETAYGVLGLKGWLSFIKPLQEPYTSGVLMCTYRFSQSNFRSSSWSFTVATVLVWNQSSGVFQLSATIPWAAKLTTKSGRKSASAEVIPFKFWFKSSCWNLKFSWVWCLYGRKTGFSSGERLTPRTSWPFLQRWFTKLEPEKELLPITAYFVMKRPF